MDVGHTCAHHREDSKSHLNELKVHLGVVLAVHPKVYALMVVPALLPCKSCWQPSQQARTAQALHEVSTAADLRQASMTQDAAATCLQ